MIQNDLVYMLNIMSDHNQLVKFKKKIPLILIVGTKGRTKIKHEGSVSINNNRLLPPAGY